ncbi:hypothetical protein [Chamaesiphon sp. OTE_75_metabat_556]|uniref:hypothetical protein n=1 Tax=Chamaesiphon sp. OTE_75_metabat_556 TaxID=2964692 RepID=UPI002869FDB3|nr:hypothetical protein [Chamaesiphon sp. OTE_75_metabat_556]
MAFFPVRVVLLFSRDLGDSFPSDLQSELDALIEAELDATAARFQAILAQN